MLGIWLEDQILLLRDDLAKPIAQSDEVLIKILTAGICNTDIELTKGYYPYTGVLGHEFVGVVETGPANLIGKRVVGEINIACGSCPRCLTGLRSHCDHRKTLGIAHKNGVFAEYITLPIENIFIVPDNVSTQAASFTEPLAAALEIQQQVNIAPNHKVLVIGDGKLGNLIMQTLLLKGCELWWVGHHPYKMASLQQHGVRVGDEAIVQHGYFDTVIECTGNPTGFKLALKALKARGTLVMKSTYAGALELNAAAIVVNELTIVGSRCGPFTPALNILARKLVDVESLIECQYSLQQGLLEFEHAMRKGAKKILLDIS